MNRRYNSKRISTVLDEISRMQNSLYALNVTDSEKYPENYALLSLDIALKSEGITCSLRNLVYSSYSIKKAEYLAKASRKHDIIIVEQDGILKITLPSLLPKKQPNQGKFLIEPLCSAFSNYVATHKSCVYAECVVYIINVHNREFSKKRYRDYDNNEAKQLIDAIATYFLVDDSGNFIDVHNTTEIGESECTNVFLIPKSKFPMWLERHFSTVSST